MSKLVFLVFLAACVIAVLVHANEDDDQQFLDSLVKSVEPELKKQFETPEARVEWKKWWNDKGKPFLVEVGKAVKPVVIQAVKNFTDPYLNGQS